MTKLRKKLQDKLRRKFKWHTSHNMNRGCLLYIDKCYSYIDLKGEYSIIRSMDFDMRYNDFNYNDINIEMSKSIELNDYILKKLMV